jgi:hypothetical protein
MTTAVDTTATRQQRRSRGGDQRRRFRDVADMWTDIATRWADAFDDAVAEMTDAMDRDLGERGRRRRGRRGCGCDHDESSCERECAPDSCQCRCCISDADLIVHARLGELRVVPIRLENHRRRVRSITLELGEFRTSGGRDAPIQATISGDRTFELGACEDTTERHDLLDVDECLVAYADLRVVGCNIRAIRIAVALLPRDCDPFVAECGCGCC